MCYIEIPQEVTKPNNITLVQYLVQRITDIIHIMEVIHLVIMFSRLNCSHHEINEQSSR